MTEKITIVKIGGNVVDNEKTLTTFLANYAKLAGHKILVHGGGKLATEMAQKMAVPTKMLGGRRITDKPMLDIAVMVYAGLINKRIVASLQGQNCDAIGLTGADGSIIAAQKRPPQPIDYGFAGDITPQTIKTARLQQLLNLGLAPVFAAITADKHGQLLNTNADTIAATLAMALASSAQVELVYCFEKKGVLRDINDENSVIAQINQHNFTRLKKQKIIADGMLPKIENALAAIQQRVHRVCIKQAEDLLNPTAGTTIQAS